MNTKKKEEEIPCIMNKKARRGVLSVICTDWMISPMVCEHCGWNPVEARRRHDAAHPKREKHGAKDLVWKETR